MANLNIKIQDITNEDEQKCVSNYLEKARLQQKRFEKQSKIYNICAYIGIGGGVIGTIAGIVTGKNNLTAISNTIVLASSAYLSGKKECKIGRRMDNKIYCLEKRLEQLKNEPKDKRKSRLENIEFTLYS